MESYEKERQKNLAYYDEHSQEIQAKYRGQYVAIAKGKLIKVTNTFEEAREAVKGYRHALVFQGDDEPIRHPARIR